MTRCKIQMKALQQIDFPSFTVTAPPIHDG
jgi:hypothetical protein